MKTLLALVTLALSTQALAAAVAPTKDELKPSAIEHVFYVQKETATQPALRLVQVDNGGSTDISAMMNPSRLYMTIHQDGEMFDIDGSYLVSNSVTDLRVLKFEKNVVTINFASKDDHLKDVKHTMTIDLTAALKEAATATGEFDDFTMKSPISVHETIR